MVRDPILIRNERLKLLAGFANAFGLALIGLGVLAPLVAYLLRAQPDGTAHPATWLMFWTAGLASHGVAHYVLGRLVKA